MLKGSIFGPVLLLKYINDLPNISDNIKITLFSDDTTVTVKDKNFTSLIINANNIMERISVWAVANRLTLSVDKTESMIF